MLDSTRFESVDWTGLGWNGENDRLASRHDEVNYNQIQFSAISGIIPSELN